MCSCFCETFCCCLLRCRDSSRNTRPSSSSRNIDAEEVARPVDDSVYPTFSETQRDYSGNVQPAPRLPMPQYLARESHISQGTVAGSSSDGRQSVSNTLFPYWRAKHQARRLSKISDIFAKTPVLTQSSAEPILPPPTAVLAVWTIDPATGAKRTIVPTPSSTASFATARSNLSSSRSGLSTLRSPRTAVLPGLGSPGRSLASPSPQVSPRGISAAHSTRSSVRKEL